MNSAAVAPTPKYSPIWSLNGLLMQFKTRAQRFAFFAILAAALLLRVSLALLNTCRWCI